MAYLLSPESELLKNAECAIRGDDASDLMSVLRNQLEGEIAVGEPVGSTLCIKELLRLICLYGAVDCFNALLEGKAAIFVNADHVNLPVDNDGCYHRLLPLHLAARKLSLGVTKALLMAGADPNLFAISSDPNPNHNNHHDVAKLPLSFALEALSRNRCVTDWSVEKSVPKLIYIFCLKELKEPLATIRLLASRTSTQHLEKLSLQYAENGQVVKLTALLLVAWTKLVTEHSQHDNVECCPIAKCIQNELQALSSSDQEMTAPRRSKFVKLESAWKMLKLLEKNYHKIDIYRLFDPHKFYYNGRFIKVIENHEVPYNLASNLSVGGPEDLCCDDIECLMPRPEPKRKAWLDRSLQTYSGKTAVYTPKSKNSLAGMFSQLSNPNFISGQRTLTTTAEKSSFHCFLPTARTCAHLLRMAKRSLK